MERRAAPPRVVLVRPMFGGNVGSSARAMLNMGLRDLRIVSPRYPDLEKAWALAHGAEDVLRAATLHDSLEAALSDCGCVVACTARPRRWRAWEVLGPAEAADRLVESTTEDQPPAALVFGPEDNGLDNDDLALATHVCHIPTAEEHSSLNLSQAVMVMAWEWAKALGRIQRRPAHRVRSRRAPKVVEVEGATGQIGELLDRLDFFRGRARDQVMATVRQALLRTEVTEVEIAAIRGAVGQMRWYIDRHPRGLDHEEEGPAR